MAKNGDRPTCQGTTVDGEPCRSVVIGPDGLCEAHKPGGLETVRRWGRRGGEVTANLHRAGLVDLPPLRTPEDAAEWLERIARAAALGRLSGSAANAARSCVRDWLEAHKAGEMLERMEALQEQVEKMQEAVQ